MRGQILLSFDVQEFDIPLEYGYHISMAEQIKIGKKGIRCVDADVSGRRYKRDIVHYSEFCQTFSPGSSWAGRATRDCFPHVLSFDL